MRILIGLLLAALAPRQSHAQQSFQFWPGATYDPAIPTIRQILGHEPGERITRSEDLARYLEALAAASPRVKFTQFSGVDPSRSGCRQLPADVQPGTDRAAHGTRIGRRHAHS